MKKLLLAILCTLSLSAQAQTYGVGAQYEYDSATNNPVGLNYTNKVGVLGGFKTQYGQFDGGFYQVHIDGDRFSDSQQGIELGYGNALPLGPFILSGRVAEGKVFNRGLGARNDTAFYRTYAAALAFPISDTVSPFIGYRNRPHKDFDEQNQYSIGVNYRLTTTEALQFSIRQTRSTNGPILNGFSTQYLHYF